MGKGNYSVPHSLIIDAKNDFYLHGAQSDTGSTTVVAKSNKRVQAEASPHLFVGKYSLPQLTTTVDIPLSFFSKAKVYPNPSKGSYHLMGTYEQVRIHNLTGTVVMEVKEEVPTLELGSFPKGLYFFEITSKEGRTVEKVILE